MNKERYEYHVSTSIHQFQNEQCNYGVTNRSQKEFPLERQRAQTYQEKKKRERTQIKSQTREEK